MTETIWPRYIGLLAWVLGIYGTNLLPSSIRQEALLVAVFGFVVWIAWDSRRRPRELKRQLEAVAVRSREQRRANEEAS